MCYHLSSLIIIPMIFSSFHQVSSFIILHHFSLFFIFILVIFHCCHDFPSFFIMYIIFIICMVFMFFHFHHVSPFFNIYHCFHIFSLFSSRFLLAVNQNTVLSRAPPPPLLRTPWSRPVVTYLCRECLAQVRPTKEPCRQGVCRKPGDSVTNLRRGMTAQAYYKPLAFDSQFIVFSIISHYFSCFINCHFP